MPESQSGSPPELNELSIICRHCGTLQSGVEAGRFVRWVVCPRCDASEIKELRAALSSLKEDALTEDDRAWLTAAFTELLDQLWELFSRLHRGVKPEWDEEQERWVLAPFDPRIEALRLALEEYVAKQEAEIKARGELWGRMCETLHACCQKYHLGLGGEHVDELVVAEIDRLHSSALTPEEAQAILNTWDWYPISSDAKHSAVSKLQSISGRSTYSRESVKPEKQGQDHEG